MEDSELEQILFSLLKNDENECIEYKEAIIVLILKNSENIFQH